MKESNYTFAEGFLGIQAAEAREKGNPFQVFDWDKAAKIIKEAYQKHPDLKAEAGLQGDWNYTGGEIFENGKPINDSYTYLGSTWADPTLILSWDGEEQEEIVLKTNPTDRLNESTKWDETSLAILGISL